MNSVCARADEIVPAAIRPAARASSASSADDDDRGRRSRRTSASADTAGDRRAAPHQRDRQAGQRAELRPDHHRADDGDRRVGDDADRGEQGRQDHEGDERPGERRVLADALGQLVPDRPRPRPRRARPARPGRPARRRRRRSGRARSCRGGARRCSCRSRSTPSAASRARSAVTTRRRSSPRSRRTAMTPARRSSASTTPSSRSWGQTTRRCIMAQRRRHDGAVGRRSCRHLARLDPGVTTPHRLRRAVRARAARHPRRGELAGARVPGGRRHAAVHGQRRRARISPTPTASQYVDLVSSWGPMILGHAHPAVVAAVQRAAAQGLSFGTPTVGEIELADGDRRRGSRRSSRCGWSTPAPRRRCRRSGWPAASPAGTGW